MLSLVPKTHSTTLGLVTWVVGDGVSEEEEWSEQAAMSTSMDC